MMRRTIIAVLIAAVLAGALGGALLNKPAPGSAPGGRTASATPTPGPHGAVARRLMALQRAYNAGDVHRICRPGRLLDDAVVARLREPGVPDCEADVELLLGGAGDMDITVEAIHRRPGLATAMVTPHGAATVPVDLVRRRGRWLVSFSAGGDPLRALTGSA
jgi:hypothetical protein